VAGIGLDAASPGQHLAVIVEQPERQCRAGVRGPQQRLQLAQVEALHQVAHGALAVLDRLQDQERGSAEGRRAEQRADRARGFGTARGQQPEAPLLEPLVACGCQHLAREIDDVEAFVDPVVAEHRLEIVLEVAPDADGVGLGTPQLLDALVDDERRGPARGVLLALLDPFGELVAAPRELGHERLTRLVAQDLLVALEEVEAHRDQRHAHAQQHEHQDLGLQADAEAAGRRRLGERHAGSRMIARHRSREFGRVRRLTAAAGPDSGTPRHRRSAPRPGIGKDRSVRRAPRRRGRAS